jgi:hypothetical protein
MSIKKASGVRVVEEGCSEMSKAERNWVHDDVKQVQNFWDPSLSVRGGRPGFGNCSRSLRSTRYQHRLPSPDIPRLPPDGRILHAE